MNGTLSSAVPAVPTAAPIVHRTVATILIALTFSHLLNDLMQSVVPAIYPMLASKFCLSLSQIGMITLVNQVTASLLQPVVGWYHDKHPSKYSLSIGMGFTFVGLLVLAYATSYPALLVAAACVGMGSSVFHPEASRIARLASGGRYGVAQTVFQVGGNLGTSLGPLFAALIIMERGQASIAWFSLAALLAMIVLFAVGRWYGRHHFGPKPPTPVVPTTSLVSTQRVVGSLIVLGLLVLSKYVYLVSFTSYYTFYLMEHFHISTQDAQIQLFVFLFAIAAGTLIGGPIGDRIGRKKVIWVSILGIAPFTIALPYANLPGTEVLAFISGFVLASAFSAILVFAQELVPGRVGLVSGLFFGFAFGVAGVGGKLLGDLADRTSLDFVYAVCSYLPLIGIVTMFLPNIQPQRIRRS